MDSCRLEDKSRSGWPITETISSDIKQVEALNDDDPNIEYVDIKTRISSVKEELSKSSTRISKLILKKNFEQDTYKLIEENSSEDANLSEEI